MGLEFDKVSKEFSSFRAVDCVNYTMKKGVYGLLGVNGAGKTTLMRMLCTIIRPTEGKIRWNGKDIFELGETYRGILGLSLIHILREVFVLQIQEWFKAVVAKDDDTMKLLSRAILDKDDKQIARQLNIVMSRMISILDTKAPDAMKENFYHGLLLGLLRGSNPDWLIKSNRESGDGFSDILIMPEDPDAGIVIEVKYAKEMKELDAACEAAITQIKDKRYDETLRDEGRCDILAYGIAFCRKRCRVVGEKF